MPTADAERRYQAWANAHGVMRLEILLGEEMKETATSLAT
jgi:hypothetical protein